MRIYDITRTLSRKTPVYPGDPAVEIIPENEGDAQISTITLCSHSGTHIDTPRHYFENAEGADRIELDNFIGKAYVIDLTSCSGSIGRYVLQGKIDGVDRLLIKTAYSGVNTFLYDYPHLSYDAIMYLIEQGVKLIGIDSPSVEEYGASGKIHRQILSHGIALLEFLDLSQISEGSYNLCALPMKIKDCDGAPVRAVLTDSELRLL